MEEGVFTPMVFLTLLVGIGIGTVMSTGRNLSRGRILPEVPPTITGLNLRHPANSDLAPEYTQDNYDT